MEIGWLCYGFAHNDFIAVDGAANIRIPIISKLKQKNHKIHWIGDVRKQNDKVKELEKLSLEEYKILVNEQRNYILKNSNSYDDYINLIENYNTK